MPATTPTRSLAAIVFTDIVGYSALAHRNDVDALRLASEHFALVRKALPAFGGQEIKTLGDSVLLKFSSAHAATACAIVIQKRHQERNRAVPAERQFQIRIGIHLGDVEHHDNDVFGDGVNIAARLQPLAPVGGIAISDHVRGQLREELRNQFVSRGVQELKNITTPVALFVIEPDAIAALETPPPPQAVPPAPSRRFPVPAPRTLLALAVVGLLLFIAKPWRYGPDGKRIQSVESDKSVAVLPFINTSNDPGNEYFSDGLSEELINALGRLRDLKVIGRNSSFQFKGKNEDSRTIAEKLGVAYLLEGSVRKASDHVRIAVELVNARDGTDIWSDTYDRQLKDIFALQSEIATAVATQLKVALLGSDALAAAAPPPPPTRNVDAYNALLQGNYYFARRTIDDDHKAIDHFREATRLDPGYALAWARLASALIVTGTTAGTDINVIHELIDQARSAAHTALRLDPNLGDAHFALGMVLQNGDMDWAGSDAEFTRAFELDPRDAAVLMQLGYHKLSEGRFDEALSLLQRATMLDPVFTPPLSFRMEALTALGRYDEAEAAVRKSIELQPSGMRSYAQLAVLQILRGHPAAAVSLAQQESDPFWRNYALAQAQFAAGNRVEADAQLQRLIAEAADAAGSQIATVYALRKEPDKMFEWLERARLMHDPGVFAMRVDPFLSAYKSDPRYEPFCRKVGLPGPTDSTAAR